MTTKKPPLPLLENEEDPRRDLIIRLVKEEARRRFMRQIRESIAPWLLRKLTPAPKPNIILSWQDEMMRRDKVSEYLKQNFPAAVQKIKRP